MTTCAPPASRVAPRPTLDTARLLALTLLPAPPTPGAGHRRAKLGWKRRSGAGGARSGDGPGAPGRVTTPVSYARRAPCTLAPQSACTRWHSSLGAKPATSGKAVYPTPAAGAPTRPGLPGTVLLLALGFLCPGNLSESQASPNGRSSEARGAAPSVPHT